MRRRQKCIVGALLVLLPSVATAVDLTGKWRFELMGEAFDMPELVQLTQTGSFLSFTYAGRAFEGNVLEGTPYTTYFVQFSELGDGDYLSIQGRILPGETLLDGRLAYILPGIPAAGSEGVMATRCTCDDGNLDDGDGCSAACQVEPCWTCAGAPSVCTPSADGSACEDGSACTTGQTCSGGMCGGGSPVSPCIDMTGHWFSHGNIDGSPDYDITTDVLQRGTDLVWRDDMGRPRVVGTIDPATGAFDVRGAPRNEPCEPFDSLTGMATALAYAAAGSVQRQLGVCQVHTWQEAGSRCGTGAVGLGEACDDGNQVNGDGCSACVVDVCWTCSGTPSVCTIGPRPGCKASTVPAKSRLLIRSDAAHANFNFLWKWKKGEDTALPALGSPHLFDAYTLCIFDVSTPTPALLFRAAVPPGGTCGSGPCWSTHGASGFVYKNKSSAPEGLTNLKVVAGSGGRAQALVKGRGALLANRPFGLPSLPLPLPMRVQLQGAAGFCAETEHDASSVRTNNPSSGVFKARGVP